MGYTNGTKSNVSVSHKNKTKNFASNSETVMSPVILLEKYRQLVGDHEKQATLLTFAILTSAAILCKFRLIWMYWKKFL